MNNPLSAYEPIGGGDGWTIYPIETKAHFIEMVGSLDEHNRTKTMVGRIPMPLIPMIFLNKTSTQYVHDAIIDLIWRTGLSRDTLRAEIQGQVDIDVEKCYGRVYSLIKLKEAEQFNVPVSVFEHRVRKLHPGQTRLILSDIRNQWLDIVYTTIWDAEPPTGIQWRKPTMFEFEHGYSHLTMLARPMSDKFEETDFNRVYATIGSRNDEVHYLPEGAKMVLDWQGDEISFNGQPVFQMVDDLWRMIP